MWHEPQAAAFSLAPLAPVQPLAGIPKPPPSLGAVLFAPPRPWRLSHLLLSAIGVGISVVKLLRDLI